MGKKKTKGRGPYKMQIVKLRGPVENNLEWAKVALTHLASSDVYRERIKQWKKWSYDHDDKHSAEDWFRLINEFADDGHREAHSPKLVRKRLAQIGALAVAGLEALTRFDAKKAKEKEEKQRGRKR